MARSLLAGPRRPPGPQRRFTASRRHLSLPSPGLGTSASSGQGVRGRAREGALGCRVSASLLSRKGW